MIHNLLCWLGLHSYRYFRVADSLKAMHQDRIWFEARECRNCSCRQQQRSGRWVSLWLSQAPRGERTSLIVPRHYYVPGAKSFQQALAEAGK